MEIWKDILGYEGHYIISNYGTIKSLDRLVFSKYNNGIKGRYEKGKIMIPHKHRTGYMCIRLVLNGIRKSYSVHRLLAQAFIENIQNKKQVNHINGIKDDNRLENLEWCDNSENQKHAYKTGISKTKLDIELLNRVKNEFIPKLAIELNMCPSYLYRIKKGYTPNYLMS